MAVGHGTAGDGRESGRGQASGDDLRAGRLPCDYASSDGRTWPGVEMAVTLLEVEIREDHACHARAHDPNTGKKRSFRVGEV